MEVVKEVRRTDSPARIALAASFSSVLIKVLGKLSYMVHLWGAKSGTGKTVAALLAVSVWADPNEDGGYLQTFNGTSVGLELQAAFVNHLPLVLDEFQLVKDKKNFEQSVYMLCEGVGRTRGAKGGGLQATPTWRNCAITSGESPITHEASGAGAMNRVIELECSENLFADPVGLLERIRGSYGFAGKAFVNLLCVDAIRKEAKRLYGQFYAELGARFTEKQAMAASVILTADAIVTRNMFADDRALTVSDMAKILRSSEDVDVNIRAFDYLYDFCVSNASRFARGSDLRYGNMDEDEVQIIGSVFDEALADGGYNPKALLHWMVENGRVKPDREGKRKRLVKIDGKPIRCVCIDIRDEKQRKKDGFVPASEYREGELPFL
jgi:hypothetical protein